MGRNYLIILLLCGYALKGMAQTKPHQEWFVEGKINVIVFLSVDCPISQKYVGTLNDIAKENRASVYILGIVPGKLKKRHLTKFQREYQVDFALRTDPSYRWTDWFNAGFTPEAFVFTADQKFIYQGAIDNWFYELGIYRQRITENYLRDIIAAELDGANPSFKKTEPVGCIIQKPVKR